MAYIDNSLVFDSAHDIHGGTTASTNVIDLQGLGAGNAVTNAFGTASVFGEDIGIGDGDSPPVLTVIVGTAFTTAASGTLQVQLQTAPDDGTGAAGTYTTALETDTLAPAVLTAGAYIAEMTIPPKAPGAAMPRFIRLNYVIASTFSAGTIAFAGITTGRNDTPVYAAAY